MTGLGEVGASSKDELRDKLLSAKRKLLPSTNDLSILDASLVQIEILMRLIEGRRTAVELTEEIYAVSPDSPSFEMYYARVRRASKDLESRGFVSTRLFGRDKPYRLTEHGVLQIASLGKGLEKRPMLVGYRDIAAFGIVAGLSILNILRIMPNEGRLGPTVSAVFFIVLGISLTRLWAIIRKVS